MYHTHFGTPAQCKVQLKDPEPNSKCEGRAAASAFASLLDGVARQTASVVEVVGENPAKFTAFDSAEVPGIPIENYAFRLRRLKFSPECFTIASILIDRLISAKIVAAVSFRNVHRLLLSSVLVAAKTHDDDYFSNTNYAKVGGISCSELNALEALLLTGIGWRVHISAEEFDEAREVLRKGSARAPETTASQITGVEEKESTGGTGECPSRRGVSEVASGGTGDCPRSETLVERRDVVRHDDGLSDKIRQRCAERPVYAAGS